MTTHSWPEWVTRPTRIIEVSKAVAGRNNMEDLTKLFELVQNGKHSEQLDELVHEEKAREASNINNSGPVEQIQYLLESGMTGTEIHETLEGKQHG